MLVQPGLYLVVAACQVVAGRLRSHDSAQSNPCVDERPLRVCPKPTARVELTDELVSLAVVLVERHAASVAAHGVCDRLVESLEVSADSILGLW